MKIKYAGREVTIARNRFVVDFPNASIFRCEVIPRKAFKLKHIPRIIELLTFSHEKLERKWLGR